MSAATRPERRCNVFQTIAVALSIETAAVALILWAVFS